MHIYIGVDPGTTTGMFQVAFNKDGLPHRPTYHVQCTSIEAAFRLRDATSFLEAGNDITLIYEKFGIGQRTHGASREGVQHALDLIGWIKVESKIGCLKDVTVEEQSPSQGKTIDNMVLEALEWYEKGKRHANDAARHVARYLINTRHPYAVEKYRKVFL